MTDSTTATNTATGPVRGPGAVRERLDRLVTDQDADLAAHQPAQQEGGPAMLGHKSNDAFDAVLDAASATDVADQQRPARPEPTDDDQNHHGALAEAVDGVGDVLEADPADIADQRRDAPVLDATEPWP